MMLYESSPGTLAPDQIEVCFRIAGRMVSFFDFKDAPDPDCAYCFDLAKPDAPIRVDGDLRITPALRFFGATKAVPKVTDIIEQHEHGSIQQEQRFGSEFTPAGKLTVLKHLQLYWGRISRTGIRNAEVSAPPSTWCTAFGRSANWWHAWILIMRRTSLKKMRQR